MAKDDRWREDRDRSGREDRGREQRSGSSSWTGESYRREGSEGRASYGREGSADIYGGDRDRERSGMWGRGDEDRGFRREGGRAYSREDYGGTGYGGGFGQDYYGGGQGRDGSGNRDRNQGEDRDRGYGSGHTGAGSRSRGSDDFGQEAYGRGFVGNEGRGFSYGSDYGRGGAGGYGGGGYGGGDYGRQGYGQRDQRDQRGGERGLWDRASDEVASWFGDRDAERRRQEDYRGRGPKGYRRSDDRVREDVNDRLADDSMVDATEVEVNVSNGEVTLSGSVDSRDARRRAEDIAAGVSGVSYVQNNLRVQRGGSSGVTAAGSATGTSGVVVAPGTGTTGTLETGSGTGRTGRTGTDPYRTDT
jgi:osmotically-inducible protein OsmY